MAGCDGSTARGPGAAHLEADEATRLGKVDEPPTRCDRALEHAAESSGAAREGLRLVVVEDDHDAASTLRELLEYAGHRVTVARDGESAVARIASELPDAVVCDLHLVGRIDGYEVARRVRHLADGARIRMVAMTGDVSANVRAATADAGFDRHLVKPVALDALERALA